MTLDQLKEHKATFDLYGTMTLHADVVNHLFDVAIAAAQPIATVSNAPDGPAKLPRKPRAKADE